MVNACLKEMVSRTLTLKIKGAFESVVSSLLLPLSLRCHRDDDDCIWDYVEDVMEMKVRTWKTLKQLICLFCPVAEIYMCCLIARKFS